MRISLLRIGLLGFGGFVAIGSLAVAWSSLVACASLSETSPLPTGDASDLDTGFVLYPEDAETPAPSTPDAGPPPASGRVRLANLLQGVKAVDLCAKRDEPTGTWEPQKITVNSPAPKPEGLLFGEVSTHIFLPVATAAGTKYLFRIVALGSPCEGDGGAPLASIASTALRQGGGLTLVAVGVVPEGGVDAGASDSIPRGVALSDVLQPPATAALLRVFHGAPDLPAFDVVINGETALTGVKYASAIGFPYTSTTGFASLPAGVPDNATLTLRAGTIAKSYKVPSRVRRGVAMTVFVGGRLNDGSSPLVVNLCADRSPPEGDQLATCTALEPQ